MTLQELEEKILDIREKLNSNKFKKFTSDVSVKGIKSIQNAIIKHPKIYKEYQQLHHQLSDLTIKYFERKYSCSSEVMLNDVSRNNESYEKYCNKSDLFQDDDLHIWGMVLKNKFE